MPDDTGGAMPQAAWEAMEHDLVEAFTRMCQGVYPLYEDWTPEFWLAVCHVVGSGVGLVLREMLGHGADEDGGYDMGLEVRVVGEIQGHFLTGLLQALRGLTVLVPEEDEDEGG